MSNKKKKIACGCCLALLLGPPLILFGGGAMMDSEASLTAEADLSASPAQIFSVLDTQDGIKAWWTAALPKTGGAGIEIVALDGPPRGVGLKVGFKVDGERVEAWELLSHEPGKSVTYLVDFQVFKVNRTITLASTPSGTHATWVEIAEFENPLMRWFKLLPADTKLRHMKTALECLDDAVGR